MKKSQIESANEFMEIFLSKESFDSSVRSKLCDRFTILLSL